MSTFGPAYEKNIDGKRLRDQRDNIRRWMLNRGWRTLAEISTILSYPEASVSAQLRHLRKPVFGSYRVEKRRRIDPQGNPTGLWEYQVLEPIIQSDKKGQLNFL